MNYTELFVKVILTGVFGAGVALITTYLNNLYQLKRDKQRYEHERLEEEKKRIFIEGEKHHTFLVNTVEEIGKELFFIEQRATLTRSVIDSIGNVTEAEFNRIYQIDCEAIIKLKSIILARFPEYYDNISRIDGLYNQYWGAQCSLLRQSHEEDPDLYRTILSDIRRLEGEIGTEVRHLIYEFKKFVSVGKD